MTQRIVLNGSGIGTTPRILKMPQSTTPIRISATSIPISVPIVFSFYCPNRAPIKALTTPAKKLATKSRITQPINVKNFFMEKESVVGF
jgi:hypothetical protein